MSGWRLNRNELCFTLTYSFILNILQTFTTLTMSLAPSNARSSRTSDLRASGWMGQEVVARTSPRSKLQVLEMVLITIREVGMDGKSFSNLVLLLCQVHQVPPTIISPLTRKCFPFLNSGMRRHCKTRNSLVWLDFHDGDSGLGVTVHDCVGNGRGTSPPWENAAVHV